MQFTRLAVVLGLTALADATDEDRAVRAAEDLKRGKLAAEQERDTARTELEAATKKITTLEAATKVAAKVRVDGLLEAAYRDGKLLYARNGEDGKALPSPREARLRRIAENDGLEALQAELAEMPVIAPVNRRVVDGGTGKDGKEGGTGSGKTQLQVQADDTNPALAAVAAQLGLDVKDVETTYSRLAGNEEA